MNRFKELRISNGFKSQKDLADRLFVNQTAVSQWERGVTTPSSTILMRLSELYGVSIDYLLGNSEKSGPTTVSDDGPDPEVLEMLKQFSPEKMEEVKRYLRFQAEQK